ncbi:ZIP family metal transporter [Haloimpatiens sp. FM7315]|uniref:ZIP family metal transporter n=1 Tax=Haloimpatiens sp. FM7315 TaxID=3298609 RepID=UPI00370A51CD
MSNYSFMLSLTCIISFIGTILGSIFGIVVKNPSKKFLSNIMGFASGVMIAIVVLDLIPESFAKLKIIWLIIYFIIGILVVGIINKYIITKKTFDEPFIRVAILVILTLAVHNFPEGLIMGCGIGLGSSLSFKMSFLIAFHDIPEGIAVAAPLMAAKEKKIKILFMALISSVPTLVGAFVGLYLGMVSKETLGVLYAFVSGIMSYIVMGEMIPEAFKLYNKFEAIIGFFIGFALGILMTMMF